MKGHAVEVFKRCEHYNDHVCLSGECSLRGAHVSVLFDCMDCEDFTLDSEDREELEK